MTIALDEAIERLEHRVQDFLPGRDPEEKEASQLGIEALKRIKWQRECKPALNVVLLPGETEE